MTSATSGPAAPRAMKIAIVAHLAYPALARTGRGHIGGVEHQTTMTARWLAAQGHDVSLLVWDEGQPRGLEIDGVKVVPLCARDAGWPVLRFVHPRWTSLWRALERVDADVCYHNCGEYVTGQVALWCRLRGRAFVYSTASDADCDVRLPLMPEWRVRALYRLGLRLADAVVAQTERQRRMLADGFQRTATVIPMPCLAPAMPTRSTHGSRTVVWIGRICRVKRPDRFIEVAQACPHLEFVIAGGGDDTPDYVRAITERAATVRNVTLLGPQNRARIDELLGGALCLCCTSDREGFPNTFLEAWSHGCPVVTTWDPDGLIAPNRLGIVGADAPALAAAITRLAESREAWQEISRSAHAYFHANHALDRVMPRFEAVFADAVASRPVTRVASKVAQRAIG